MQQPEMVTRLGSPFPRRQCVDLYHPVEQKIADAKLAVEMAGAHPLLTEALILLGQAQDKFADWWEREDDGL